MVSPSGTSVSSPAVSKPPLLSRNRLQRGLRPGRWRPSRPAPSPSGPPLVPVVEAAKGWPIWLSVAGGMAVTGDPGRRTAAHAVTASVTASMLGQVVKRQVRRTRPRRVPWPKPAAQPRVTYSFPSGHAATGAAFATTVCSRMSRSVSLSLSGRSSATPVYGAGTSWPTARRRRPGTSFASSFGAFAKVGTPSVVTMLVGTIERISRPDSDAVASTAESARAAGARSGARAAGADKEV